MSKIEDFKNAPLGATATHKVTGIRATKIDDGEQRWITPSENQYNDEEMVFWEYTLDPTVPTTAREALDMGWNLAWELAYPVKEGQTIPTGTRYLEIHGDRVREYAAHLDFKISPELAPTTRTLDPLPGPEPDWLDAPAVAAPHWCPDRQAVWLPTAVHGYWKCPCCGSVRHWSDLHGVTPLYPKEGR